MAKSRFIQALSGLDAGSYRRIIDRIIVGRSPTADVQVMDAQVSRNHAALEINDDGETMLRDLASRNGTFVNGRKVDETILEPGMVFRVGHSDYFYGEAEGEIEDSKSYREGVKVLNLNAVRQSTLTDRKIVAIRKVLEGRFTPPHGAGKCQDETLHTLAAKRQWSFCPACGEPV